MGGQAEFVRIWFQIALIHNMFRVRIIYLAGGIIVEFLPANCNFANVDSFFLIAGKEGDKKFVKAEFC